MNTILTEILNPLAQMEDLLYLDAPLTGNIHISIVNIGSYLIVGLVLIMTINMLNTNRNRSANNNWSITSETIYAIILSIVISRNKYKTGLNSTSRIFKNRHTGLQNTWELKLTKPKRANNGTLSDAAWYGSSATEEANEWHRIDWKEAGGKIKDLQEKIVNATNQKNMREIYRLQWTLLQSPSAEAMAIRKVVTNKGGKTAGTDGTVWDSPKLYWQGMMELRRTIANIKNYEASPLRRVYIPKGNGEKRPLGIPTMIDRAVQAIYHLGVDPAVEAQSEPNSYGFRKRRSTHDAVTALRSHLDKPYSPRWVLEADIAKCFDRISHEFLLKHTPIVHRTVLEKWLTSGVMEEMNYMETSEGTPQGGIISPTLCNIALNGIEKTIEGLYPAKRGISAGVHTIRYADDLVITGKNQEILIECKKAVAEFLTERGLELSEKKTRITHVDKGFDFLGFNFRRMPRDWRLNQAGSQGTVLIIRPSEKGIKKIVTSISKIINFNKPLERIISDINPVLRGWGEHKRISYHSQAIFIRLDNWIFWKMAKWSAKRGHSVKANYRRQIISTESRKWNWGMSKTKKIMNLGEIPIIQLRPLALNRNPYLKKDEDYFNKRIEKLTMAKFRAAIYKKYKHLCTVCGESLHNGEPVELHHVVPQKAGGKHSMKNTQPLHQICHKKITHGV